MSNMPWFRFYSEALSDRKMARACRIADQPKACVMGVWLTLLCLANDSPERGKLLIGKDIWMEEDEILAETGLDPLTFGRIITAFQKLNMLSVSAGFEVLNWDKRQFSSDNSTPRVRAWREKQRAKKQQVKQGETLQKRSSNAIEQNREEKKRVDEDSAPITEPSLTRPKTRERNSDPLTDSGIHPLVNWWLDLVGGSKPSDSDYARAKLFEPAAIILDRFSGNTPEIKRLLMSKRAEMLSEGKTPKWLEAMVPYIVADIDKENSYYDPEAMADALLS